MNKKVDHETRTNFTNSANTCIPRHYTLLNSAEMIPDSLSDGLTVVTAFFNIGKFQKGNGGRQFSARLYRDWARVFARLESPTVIFVDSDEFRRHFAELRSLHLPDNLTVIRQLDRQQVCSLCNSIVCLPTYLLFSLLFLVSAVSLELHCFDLDAK